MQLIARLGQATRSLGAACAELVANARTLRLSVVAGRVVAVLLGLELLYLGVANGIARSDLVKNLVKTSGQFQLEYASAYTLWPGHVHVDGVRFLAEDYNVQFSLELDQVVVDISLHELMFKKFHATRVDAEGTRFRFRHKAIVVGDDADRLAAYPPIRGFSDPPLYRGLRPPPIPDAEYDLWEVRVEQVNAAITELWGLEYRFRGRARAVGSFMVRPARWVQVEPATLTIETGTVTLGEQLVAADVRGRVTCSVPDMDVRASEGLQVLKDISATLKVDLLRGELGFLNVYQPPESGVQVDGKADWAFDVNVRRAEIQVGSTIALEAKPLTVRAEQAQVNGGISLQITRKAQSDPALSITLLAPLLAISKPQQKAESPRLEQLESSLAVTTVDLTQPPTFGAGRVAVKRAVVPSLAWFDEGDTALRGNAEAAFDGQRNQAGTTSGELALKVSEGRVAKGDFVANGQIRSNITFVRGSKADAPLQLTKAELALSQVSLRSGEKASKAFGAAINASGFEFFPSDPPAARGTVVVNVTSADALLPLVISAPLRGIASTALDLKGLTARAAVTVNGPAITVKVLNAKSGNLTIKGYFSSPRGTMASASGAFLLTAGVVNMGVSLRAGSTEVSPFVGDDWLASPSPAPSKAKDHQG